MTEKIEDLIEEARRAAPGDDATELAVMVHRLIDALEAETRERAAVPDAATEIERYRDAAEGNRIRLVHAQNDAEQFEAERDAALAAIARVRAVCVEAEATKNRNRAWTKRLGYASTSTHDPVPGLKEVLAALDGAPEPEWEYGLGNRKDPRDVGNPHPEAHARWLASELEETPTFVPQLMRRRKAGPWLPVEGEKR